MIVAQFVNIFPVELNTEPASVSISAYEGDANSLRVGAQVTDGGAYTALGGSCVGKAIRADGATVPLTGTISGNLAYVVLDQTCCAVEGPIEVSVIWVSGGNKTTLLKAYGIVIRTETGNAIQPSTPIPDLTELLAEVDEMRAATAAANAAAAGALSNFAGAFSDATAYTAGQYVTYTDGYFYRFKVDHAAGAWSNSDVDRVTTGGELFKALIYRGILPNNSDLNDVVQPGIYGVNSEYTISHKPTWQTGGLCMVIQYASNIIIQIAYSVSAGITSQRSLINSPWSGWSSETARKSDVNESAAQINDKSPHFIVVTEDSAESVYSKLAANLPGNTFCYVSASWFTDLPAGTYWLFTHAAKNAYTDLAAQYTYEAGTGRMYTRSRSYSSGSWSWGAWVLKDDPANTILWKGTLANNTDLNNVDGLSLYGISDAYSYTNKPTLLSSGYLFTVDFGAGFITQFASDLDGSNVYTRRKRSGVWSDWFCGVHDTTAKYFAFGDSTTYGQIPGTANQSKYNYPACVGKLLHMQTINKGVPGQGLLTDWDDIQTDFIDALDMTGAKLVTLAWAYNDGSQYASINFGAYTDTGSNTFIGKYFTIMKQFQQKCPYAKIVLITGFGYPDGQVGPPAVKPTFAEQFTHIYTFADGTKTIKQMYDTLEAMCNLHGWSCINQATGTVFNAWNVDEMIGDQIHPTEAGYLTYGNFLAGRITSVYGNIAAWN